MRLLETSNISCTVSEFILLGFPCRRETQILLFVLFSMIYFLTIVGNTSIICAVWSSRQLHMPMYLLLANFSSLELCYVGSDVPKLLANIISQKKTISFAGCILQFYFFFSMCASEGYFLSAMAFDRYLAICRPLYYPTITTQRLYAKLVFFCWLGGFLSILLPVILLSQVPFCGPNVIDHFFCDLGPLLALSCVPVPKTTLTCATVSSLIIFITFLYILGSYTHVLRAVLKVPAGTGRNKAFSTCASHFVVVSLFYGSVMVMYVSPGSKNQPGMRKFVTLFYCMATPFFNPLIYSLQNKDMKDALKKVLKELSQEFPKGYEK
ncbi:olfactory receptor 11H2-like [Vombatus ursinus]|uniref:olfactory receptor 11H2-like n=1 Tax=Vombatus ursinus TaxID=29139 RepID=UPI000FFD6AA6|nr:olfactory receptor 11H2-like [Vombatus ursinus]